MTKLPLNIRLRNMKHNYEVCFTSNKKNGVTTFIQCKNRQEMFDYIKKHEGWTILSIREVDKYEC